MIMRTFVAAAAIGACGALIIFSGVQAIVKHASAPPLILTEAQAHAGVKMSVNGGYCGFIFDDSALRASEPPGLRSQYIRKLAYPSDVWHPADDEALCDETLRDLLSERTASLGIQFTRR